RLRGRQVPADLGGTPGGRQEAQSQGASARPDAGAHVRRRAGVHLSVSVVVGWQGGRRGRQGGARQQGDGRLGQVHGRVLEGGARRRRACLGRFQQRPRVSR